MIGGFIKFLAALMIIALTAVMFQVSLAIYAYVENRNVNAVLLQDANAWQNRIDSPVALEHMDEVFLKNRLIIRFVNEYLSVTPSREELTARAGQRGALAMMSHPAVLAVWRREVLPGLERMANARQYRTVSVRPMDIRRSGEFYVVPFRVTTWTRSNDLTHTPEVEAGYEMFLRVRFEKGLRSTIRNRPFNVGRFLDAGMPPPAIFRFAVDEVVIR